MQSKPNVTISEASLQTGVASVTLRAWERRYGLIKPERTAKGHRLYSPDNIAQINTIVSWLERGVSISKVAALLNSDSVDENIEHDIQGAWKEVITDIVKQIKNLKQISANQLLDKLNKSQPLINLCEQVYLPCHRHLSAYWKADDFDHQLEKQVWLQVWQRQMTLMSLRAEKQKPRASAWLVNSDKDETSIDYYLLYGLLLQSGIRVHPISKIASLKSLATINYKNQIPLMIVGTHLLPEKELAELFVVQKFWRQNFFIIGHTASIHSQALSDMAINHSGGAIYDCWRSIHTESWLQRIIANQ